jgi:hypothetical protein
MAAIDFPNPATQTPVNTFSPTSTPSATANGVTYTWDGEKWVAQVAGGGSSQWTTTGSDIYYDTGKVLVGTTNATDNARLGVKLGVVGTSSYPGISITGYLGTSGSFPILDLTNSRGTTDGSYTKVESGDCLGRIHFRGSEGTQWGTCATIDAYVDGATGSGDLPGRLVFSTTADGASSPTQRMKISSGGNVEIGTTSSPSGSVSATGFTFMEGNGFWWSTTGANSYWNVNTQTYFNFRYNGSGSGAIIINNGSVNYNTSSDYRIKENVVPLIGAIDRIKQLQVHRFNFLANPDKIVDGFIAHEVQDIVPEAISGTKDEVDADGNPIYQGIDQSKLVPLITAALQEALQKIETQAGVITALNARITALEAN